ncbi:phage tail assembly chaperone [Longicatena caecimuris]|uniref:phage tail assembly chaperone n=1 Tax=Longicatena caecimuris TaxID=1796635 RepID=UPI003AB6B260
MSKFSKFMKANKVVRENTKYAATSSLVDPETGKPLEWELKPLTTQEVQRIQDECTVEVPTGKPNVFRTKMLTTKFVKKLICASVVVPNLYDAELQDSYDVKTPEELLEQLVDDPGEYNAFSMFVQKFNHLDKGLQDKVDEAKN